MAVEIAQPNPVSLQTLADVLFYSTGDEDSEWDGWVLLEEAEDVIDEVLNSSLVLALIESVDDNDERPFGKCLPEDTFLNESLKRREDQELELHSQRDVPGY
ncbi:hypothetical protein EST38_g1471 [Candolleomyces aberdarensis]|uniref:Uncharacterized protein n=1 Tax=Candolleomyces aberdarensis TaxID=2316362 RepID=A0A4Q2DXA5_9AGAR|nr:hypothetical protein EST38_g1471 [Candolleomyces aberdarensis]